MTIVSLTVVTIFRVAGVILVVALMTIPPATAYLLTNRLSIMIVLSLGIASLSAVAGTIMSWELGGVGIASLIATFSGVIFIFVLILTRRKDFILTRHEMKPQSGDNP